MRVKTVDEAISLIDQGALGYSSMYSDEIKNSIAIAYKNGAMSRESRKFHEIIEEMQNKEKHEHILETKVIDPR